MSDPNTLSVREEKFCECVLSGMSYSDAYREAYKPQKASNKTINEKASRLMAQDKIRSWVEDMRARARESYMQQLILNEEGVLQELTRIATGTQEYPSYDMFGNERLRAPSVKQRLDALEMLGKYHKLFADRQLHEGSITIGLSDELSDYAK